MPDPDPPPRRSGAAPDLQPIGDALRATFPAGNDGLPDGFARLFIELAHLDTPAEVADALPAQDQDGQGRLRRLASAARRLLRKRV